MSATANLPAKAQIEAGRRVGALIPSSFDQAFRVAQAIALSDMAPKDMKSPEKILVAIMAGAEIGLPPIQAIQSIAVINGRPSLWGDGLMAVVRAQGVRVREWMEGEGDALTALCEATRPSGEVIPGRFSVADAKKAGLWGKTGPWQQYPNRMLAMRARAFALRDGCADMLRGIQVREEVQDYGAHVVREVTAPAETLRLERAAPAGEVEIEAAPEPEIIDLEPCDAIIPDEPAAIALDTDLSAASGEQVEAWVELYKAAILAAPDEAEAMQTRTDAFQAGQIDVVDKYSAEIMAGLDRFLRQHIRDLRTRAAA